MIRAVLALTLAGLWAAPAADAACAPEIAYLVRHAEKASGADRDPVLSDAGQARAQALRDWFASRRVDAIYVTHLRRTQHSAAPLAQARDLELRVLPAGDSAPLLARLRERHCGEHVLVVGHSNTVPEIAAALGGVNFTIDEHEYGEIFVLRPPGSTMERVPFGERVAPR